MEWTVSSVSITKCSQLTGAFPLIFKVNCYKSFADHSKINKYINIYTQIHTVYVPRLGRRTNRCDLIAARGRNEAE